MSKKLIFNILYIYVTLRLGNVVDVLQNKNTYCTRWGLRSSSPLRVAAIQIIGTSSGSVIYSILIFCVKIDCVVLFSSVKAKLSVYTGTLSFERHNLKEQKLKNKN